MVGAEVFGFTNERGSHADCVLAEAAHLAHKPAGVSRLEAGALKVAGTTAWAVTKAVCLGEGDVVVISGAAVGWARWQPNWLGRRGARVIGLASPANHESLADYAAVPRRLRSTAVSRTASAR